MSGPPLLLTLHSRIYDVSIYHVFFKNPQFPFLSHVNDVFLPIPPREQQQTASP